MRYVVIPLGELGAQEVAAAVREQLGLAELDELAWLDRGELRRAPLRTLMGLLTQRFEAAVLVAPDLQQRRLRLTSLLLALPQAKRRWRIDVHGRRETWRLRDHLAGNALPVARHLAAFGLAATLGEPLLQLIERLLIGHRRFPLPLVPTPAGPMHRVPATPLLRLLYLRSQLWLGLTGGGRWRTQPV